MDIKPTEPDLDLAVNSLKEIRISLTADSRRRLALLCQNSLQNRQRNPLISWLEWVSPARVLQASSAVVLVLVGAAVFVLVRPRPPLREGDQQPVRLVSVAPSPSGGVTLSWEDGNQRVYKVLKSTDPRDFDRAEVHAVRGNHWTDEGSQGNQVVYYKVE